MSSNKFILIHSNYPPDNHGGIETVVSQIMDLLGSIGYLVKCFCGSNLNSGKLNNRRQVVYSRRILMRISGAPLLSFGNTFLIWYGRRADLLIYQEPFPLLWPAIYILSRFYKIPIVVVVHANPVASNKISKLYSYLRSFVFKGSVCVATTPNVLCKVASLLYSRNMVIPLGISRKIKITSHGKILPTRFALYLGRLSTYKGIPYLLQSINSTPDITFVIAGTGQYSKDIHTFLIEKKIKNLIFINKYLTTDEKNELFSKCEFFLFPSINQNEAFGIVQLEAMRFSKPIVNTWIDSGVNYVAPNQICALTVKPSNPEALSIAIRKLWYDSELCQRLGKQGNERFINLFSEESFKASWTYLVKDIFNNFGKP